MAKKPKKVHHGLADDKRPIVLTKSSGERIVAQSELAQLQEKRDRLQADLHELDSQILALKTKRKDELLAELEALGLDVVPAAKARAASSRDGKRRGRPEGFKMSEQQKEKMREGRQKAKAARDRQNAEPELPMNA
jgi:hypothetical protein